MNGVASDVRDGEEASYGTDKLEGAAADGTGKTVVPPEVESSAVSLKDRCRLGHSCEGRF